MTSYRLAGASALLLGLLSAVPAMAQESGIPDDASNFYKSDRVTMQPVTFPNQYKMTIAGDLFVPKGMNPGQKHAAIIVGHPMGAVKEQSACLYATKMAEQGFVTLAVDLSFWGGSSGEPRNAVSPDLYAETFSAAADFLGTRPFVDRDKIGVIGICGSGSFAISAAKIDPRLKAIATISMYDMGAANRNGLRHGMTLEQRKQILREAAEQRYAEFTGGETRYTSGTVHELTETSSLWTVCSPYIAHLQCLKRRRQGCRIIGIITYQRYRQVITQPTVDYLFLGGRSCYIQFLAAL